MITSNTHDIYLVPYIHRVPHTHIFMCAQILNQIDKLTKKMKSWEYDDLPAIGSL